jgi:hypothetical protein
LDSRFNPTCGYRRSHMFWIVKKSKDFWSWISFIWHILGWLGGTSLITGLAAMAIGVAGAMIKDLPWPIILMAGYCTLVGVVYLSMAPMAFKVLSAALQPKDNASANQRILIRPHYEAWKHVEKFTLVEASYLWNDLEPKAKGNYTTEVQAWIDAFCAVIRTGELNFIPEKPHDLGYTRFQKANPGHDTQVRRADLSDFAMKNNYKPKFLSQHSRVSY